MIKGRRLPRSESPLSIIREYVKSWKWGWLLLLCLVGGCQPSFGGGGWVGLHIHVHRDVLTQYACISSLSLVLDGVVRRRLAVYYPGEALNPGSLFSFSRDFGEAMGKTNHRGEPGVGRWGVGWEREPFASVMEVTQHGGHEMQFQSCLMWPRGGLLTLYPKTPPSLAFWEVWLYKSMRVGSWLWLGIRMGGRHWVFRVCLFPCLLLHPRIFKCVIGKHWPIKKSLILIHSTNFTKCLLCARHGSRHWRCIAGSTICHWWSWKWDIRVLTPDLVLFSSASLETLPATGAQGSEILLHDLVIPSMASYPPVWPWLPPFGILASSC